jgi:hypothetical protein
MIALTFDEAAKRASLTRRSLERHFAQGTGPAVVVLGKRRRAILDVDFEKWLLSRRLPAPGEKPEISGSVSLRSPQ